MYRQDYEWKQHVIIAKSIGMTEAEIEAVKTGASDPVWNDFDRRVLQATEDMYAGRTIADDTWNALASEFDHAQMLELLFTIGTFAMMSWIFNCTRLQVEDES